MELDEAKYRTVVGEDFEGPLFSAMAAAPTLAGPYFDFGVRVRQSCGLEPPLRELTIATTLSACGAEDFARRHLHAAAELGVERGKLERLPQFESAIEFTDREKAVLRFARESAVKVNVSAEAYGGLQAWFDIQGQTAVVLLTAYYAGLAQIANSLERRPA